MNETTRAPGELEGAIEVARLADAGQAYIFTAGITTGEILNRHDGSLRARFKELFERPNYRRITIVDVIEDIAAELRDEWNLRLPDALHVATAMRIRADAMHTFDHQLIALSGKAKVNNLPICIPSADQKELAL